eukprot:TRINITY_DN4281_c0_g1_i3.p1 TRINITY_DN4281_c0_g1~~TRINITY_DN4281_c0_g1_i3.p1  ORF type:complete len:731 (-),score=92.45 TRINITY_DN4281_c0_g1_i3:9-2201(-)
MCIRDRVGTMNLRFSVARTIEAATRDPEPPGHDLHVSITVLLPWKPAPVATGTPVFLNNKSAHDNTSWTPSGTALMLPSLAAGRLEVAACQGYLATVLTYARVLMWGLHDAAASPLDLLGALAGRVIEQRLCEDCDSELDADQLVERLRQHSSDSTEECEGQLQWGLGTGCRPDSQTRFDLWVHSQALLMVRLLFLPGITTPTALQALVAMWSPHLTDSEAAQHEYVTEHPVIEALVFFCQQNLQKLTPPSTCDTECTALRLLAVASPEPADPHPEMCAQLRNWSRGDPAQSTLRAQGLGLAALLQKCPCDAKAACGIDHATLASLLATRQIDPRSTVTDKAVAMIALLLFCDSNPPLETDPPTPRLTLSVTKQQFNVVLQLNSDGMPVSGSVRYPQFPASSIEVHTSDSEPVVLGVALRYVPFRNEHPQANGISVIRSATFKQLPIRDPDTLKVGDVVTVTIACHSKIPRQNVLIIESLPGALGRTDGGIQGDRSTVMTVLDELGTDEFTFEYQAIVSAEGSFYWPAARVQCLDQPAVMGMSAAGLLNIQSGSAESLPLGVQESQGCDPCAPNEICDSTTKECRALFEVLSPGIQVPEPTPIVENRGIISQVISQGRDLVGQLKFMSKEMLMKLIAVTLLALVVLGRVLGYFRCLGTGRDQGNGFETVELDENQTDTFCLLYTSDAADEEDSVDLGGLRIIKKKKRRGNKKERNSNRRDRRINRKKIKR